MRDITVTFAIDDEIEKKLDQLLPLWQNWTDPDTGRKPFLGYEKDRLFQDIMECGCVPYAKEKLASFERNMLAQQEVTA